MLAYFYLDTVINIILLRFLHIITITTYHFYLLLQMCLDPALAIQCGDKPPPLYVCVDCVDQLRREHAQFLVDLLRPLEKVSLICENKVQMHIYLQENQSP